MIIFSFLTSNISLLLFANSDWSDHYMHCNRWTSQHLHIKSIIINANFNEFKWWLAVYTCLWPTNFSSILLPLTLFPKQMHTNRIGMQNPQLPRINQATPLAPLSPFLVPRIHCLLIQTTISTEYHYYSLWSPEYTVLSMLLNNSLKLPLLSVKHGLKWWWWWQSYLLFFWNVESIWEGRAWWCWIWRFWWWWRW